MNHWPVIVVWIRVVMDQVENQVRDVMENKSYYLL